MLVYYENAYVVSKYIMKQLGLCFHYRDSRWGVRDVDDVEHLAEQNKMSLIKTVSAYFSFLYNTHFLLYNSIIINIVLSLRVL